MLHRYVELLDKYFGNVSVLEGGDAKMPLRRFATVTNADGLRCSEEAFTMDSEPR